MHDIHLPDENRRRRNHRDNDQWKIQFTELPLANVYSLLLQNIPPEQPGQRSADRKRERPVIRPDCERINRSVSFFRV